MRARNSRALEWQQIRLSQPDISMQAQPAIARLRTRSSRYSASALGPAGASASPDDEIPRPHPTCLRPLGGRSSCGGCAPISASSGWARWPRPRSRRSWSLWRSSRARRGTASAHAANGPASSEAGQLRARLEKSRGPPQLLRLGFLRPCTCFVWVTSGLHLRAETAPFGYLKILS